MNDCIFCKIANREVPKEFTYEDEDIMVFPDIHPQKPVHLLVIPKKHIKEFVALEDPDLSQKLFTVAQKMVAQHGLEDKGYRIMINGGGLQDVDHLHIHVLGPMGSTPKA